MDYRWTTAEMCIKTYVQHTWRKEEAKGIIFNSRTVAFKAYCAIWVRHSNLHHQASPRMSPRESTQRRKVELWARKVWKFLPKCRIPRYISGSFTCRKATTCNRRLHFPSEGRCAEDFFTLKNPTASAGCEPANLGTKGQQATSRPPKLLNTGYIIF